MIVFEQSLVFAACLALTWAGLEKARTRRPLVAALRALDVKHATLLATAVPIFELSVVAAALAGFSLVASLLLLVLAVGFTSAGASALLMRKTIQCACFGVSERETLGWHQIAAFPVWLAVAWAAHDAPMLSAMERLSVFVVALLALVALQGVRCARAFTQARGDRRATAGA